MQLWAARSHSGKRASAALGFLPVPATAVVLFIVVLAVLPQLGPATDAALGVIPFYILFATIAPFIGCIVGRLFPLDPAAGRAVAFREDRKTAQYGKRLFVRPVLARRPTLQKNNTNTHTLHIHTLL